MKINETQRIGSYRAYQQATETRTENASGKRRLDEVNFSAEDRELLDARQSDRPADRSQQIEQLKDQLSAGTYRVPDHLLLEKLLPFIK